MTRLLISFLVLLGSVYLGTQLHADPGYVMLSFHQWTVETTIGFALIALFFIIYLLSTTMHLIHHILKAPETLKRWYERHQTQKAQAITRQGLIEYSEGYWKQAQHHLIQALPNADTPLLNYLTAARAAQKMGDSTLRDHYLREAQQSMPEAKIAVELTQAELQLANNQWEQALATLRHLQDLAPKHPYVLNLLMHLYQEVKDWSSLIALLPSLKRYTIISDEAFASLQNMAYLNALYDLIKQDQRGVVQDFYYAMPKTVAANPELIVAFARFLVVQHELEAAEALLRKHLKKDPNPLLIACYAQPLQLEIQLPFAESLLKRTRASDALYQCLGQLCIQLHLWGKAKTYLEQAIELKPSPQAFYDLASLHEHLGEPELSCAYYKKGLDMIVKA